MVGYSSLVLLVVLSSVSSLCIEEYFICVTNDAERACNHPSNITVNVASVSRLLRNPPRCLTLHFTSGLHVLEKHLVAEVSSSTITIIGEIHPPTRVQCNTNVLWFENHVLFLFNITFEKCSPRIAIAAIYVKSTFLTLKNVVMQNSGRGIRVEECQQIKLSNCTFLNNSKGHIDVSIVSELEGLIDAHIEINQSRFYNGFNKEKRAGLLISRFSTVRATCTIKIFDSVFLNNTPSHIIIKEEYSDRLRIIERTMVVRIERCTFMQSFFGIYIAKLDDSPENIMFVSVSKTTIASNIYAGIVVSNSNFVRIFKNKVLDNSGTGISIVRTFACDHAPTPVISKVEFVNNSLAVSLGISFCQSEGEKKKEAEIRECIFDNNKNISSLVYLFDTLYGSALYPGYDMVVQIKDSNFTNNVGRKERNSTININCSLISAFNLTVVMSNASFINNTCTGILLNSTALKIEKDLYFVKNYVRSGSAIYITKSPKKSSISFYPNTSIHCVENRATKFGGVIYSDETCEEQRKECFFQLDLVQTFSPTFYFTSNRADEGGDAIFGGCLSGCLQQSGEVIDLQDSENIFWNLISLSTKYRSQSNFAEHPYRVVFCDSASDSGRLTCKDDHEVSVFRGGTFTVKLMVTGDLCSPSFNIIHASMPPGLERGVEIRRGDNYQQANPSCEPHTYGLRGGQGNASNFTLSIELDLQEKSFIRNGLNRLTVHYINQCPPGFQLDAMKEKCRCSSLLESEGVVCVDSDFSFNVPALTWIGIFKDQVAIGTFCQYCKANGVRNIKNLSMTDDLCIEKRTGTLCGKCGKRYSIKLGGYQCDDCSKSSYQGYLLTFMFAIVGFILVLTMLKFNFTVSTGLINGLIFYANIVYSNHSFFLPLNRDINGGYLNNAVYFLFIFKAWLNLDFGFDICYFHNTDTYIVTWLQFAFPIYIWLIIFVVVVASRYSTRLSKFTGHNTISVLATLLFLSYTKLLLAVLSALSYTVLQLSDNKISAHLWSSDGNVPYLAGKHAWLFIMSFLMIILYIFPFTVLVALGPFLISKSRHRVLRWIHRLRPFLDAFYGPYTRDYYYWPGILLILRVIIVFLFAFYSTGDGSFVLLSIVLSLVSLFLLWMVIGKTHKVSLHRKRALNLLELFFVTNLTTFAAISLYFRLKYPKQIHRQQILAVVMTGSVFCMFCCIVAYNIFSVVRSWRITQKIIRSIRNRKKSTDTAIGQEQLDEDSIGTYFNNRGNTPLVTQSEVEMSIRIPPRSTNDLREPLLELKD